MEKTDTGADSKGAGRRPNSIDTDSCIKLFYIYLEYLIGNAGSSMTWPVTSLYVHNYLHQSFFVTGIVLMMGSIVSMLASWLAGFLFDRWHPFSSFLISLVLAFAGSIMIFFIHDWPYYVFWLLLLNIGVGMFQTLINSYGSISSFRDPKSFFSNMAIMLNVGTVIGTFFGTWIFDRLGIRGSVLLAAFFYVLMFVIAISFFNRKIAKPVISSENIKKSKRTKNSRLNYPPLLLSIGALTMMTYLTYQFWETVMSPHMVSLGMTVEQYGYLWTINGIIIILFQNLVTKITSKWSLSKSVTIGTFIFSLTFPPLIWADRFWQMVIITVILVFGEMLFSPGTTAWVSRIVPSNFQGQGMAFISASISLGRAVGPIYAGIFMDKGWVAPLFISSFVILVALDLLVFLMSKRDSNSYKPEL
ncbi:MFS transporter [Oenococcus alcoholitolerans]|uniref:Major facilitator transporter n=1 Tax=Oenococcus alcoholitolerans TaxID=931074 RepID=A0ABR4XQJ9_9LACO|nr:major facilitator transporter [Oenococcus alcoholitolerans]